MLILVVLLAVTHAFVPVLGQTTDSAASNSQKQADSRNQDQKPAPAVSRVKSQDKSSSIQGTESNKRPDDYQQPTINVTNPAPMPESWSWHDKIAWGASLLLLVVAAVTLRWFIIQNNATKKAADAALLNAQAVISAERPWIVLDVAIDHDKTFIFSAKNVGRSAAKIISICNRVPFIVDSDALPTPPDYREEDEFVNTPILLPPGEMHCIAFFNFGKFQDANFQWASAVQFGGGKSIYIYGRIQYLPMPEMPGSLADPWETRYCRWYVPIDIPTFADGRCPKEYTLYK